MIEVYLNGTPWAVATTLAALLALLLAGPALARRTGLPHLWGCSRVPRWPASWASSRHRRHGSPVGPASAT